MDRPLTENASAPQQPGPESGSAIRPRSMRFEIPDTLEALWIPGQPELSHLLNGASLILPYLEPYLIQTMKRAMPSVSNPALVRDMEAFNAQEAYHFQQHMRFNQVLGRQGYDGIAELETIAKKDYSEFAKTRSLRFNIAYAEGFEVFTGIAARVLIDLDSEWIDSSDSVIARLFTWHLCEELEHRTVCFDVYQHLYGDHLYRIRMQIFALRHLAGLVRRNADFLIRRDVERGRIDDQSAARMRAVGWRLQRRVLPQMLRTYLPWYHPKQWDMSPRIRSNLAHYDQAAG